MILNPWTAMWAEWTRYWWGFFWPYFDKHETPPLIMVPPPADEETVS